MDAGPGHRALRLPEEPAPNGCQGPALSLTCKAPIGQHEESCTVIGRCEPQKRGTGSSAGQAPGAARGQRGVLQRGLASGCGMTAQGTAFLILRLFRLQILLFSEDLSCIHCQATFSSFLRNTGRELGQKGALGLEPALTRDAVLHAVV